MPPPLENEEHDDEEDLEHQDASSSDSDEVIEIGSPLPVDFPETDFYSHRVPEAEEHPQAERHPEPFRQGSPVPLVLSDIVTSSAAAPVQRAALPAAKPAKVKMATKDSSRKRRSGMGSSGLVAKKRKGNTREMPCMYCVRRLANDPRWACHDALIGQNGIGSYSGTRCSECVGAHVSCNPVPNKATETVRTLVKTAADAAASDGTKRPQLLAAYEAAIGPALRAIILPPSTHNAELAQKRKRGRKGGFEPNPNPPQPPASTSSKRRDTPSQWARAAAQSYSSAGAAQQPHAPANEANQASSFATPPPHQQQQQQQQQQQDVDKLERQALRRRKVEALESLSHTAALFLAEFMTFTKQQQQQSSSSSPGGAGRSAEPGSSGGTTSASVQNHGMNYAAAAAGMVASVFQPHADGAAHYLPYGSRNSTNDHEDSDSESSDASTIENNASAFERAQIQAQREGRDGYPMDDISGDSGSDGDDLDREEHGDDDDDDCGSVVHKQENDEEQRQIGEVKVEDE